MITIGYSLIHVYSFIYIYSFILQNDGLLCEGCELITDALLDMIGQEEVEVRI